MSDLLIWKEFVNVQSIQQVDYSLAGRCLVHEDSRLSITHALHFHRLVTFKVGRRGLGAELDHRYQQQD